MLKREETNMRKGMKSLTLLIVPLALAIMACGLTGGGLHLQRALALRNAGPGRRGGTHRGTGRGGRTDVGAAGAGGR